MEFTLLFAALSGVVAGWIGLRAWSDRLPNHAADRLIGAAVTGLLVGRITAMITQGVNPLSHLGDMIIVRGGVDTGAAAIGFLVFLLWSSRKDLVSIDAIVPAVVLAMAGWHAGCLWRGACLGTPSELPWSWAQSGSGITRHPVEIYAAVALALAAVVIARLPWRPWLRFGAGLVAISAVRLLTEPLRPSLDGGPTGWYLTGWTLGVIVMLIGPTIISPCKHPAPT